MTLKGKSSEVGENAPTEKSNQEIENLVDDVLDSPALAPKSTLPKEDAGLNKEDNEQEQENPEEQSKDEDEGGETETKEGEENLEESEDEDVVPASKHKRALEKMQRRIDELTAKNKASKLKDSSSNAQESKLEALSINELQELRENVEESIIDAKVAAKTKGVDATTRVNELKELKRSIDKTIRLAPKKFADKQVEHYDQMVEVVKDIDPKISDRKGELFNMAVQIYRKSPSLQGSETGQAEALALAAEYYLEKKSLESGREKSTTLSKKVQNLKRKTALDGKNRMGNAEQVSNRRLKETAVKGTYYDKLDYVKSLIPDDFLQPG